VIGAADFESVGVIALRGARRGMNGVPEPRLEGQVFVSVAVGVEVERVNGLVAKRRGVGGPRPG
jgi:hypothetical protein